uniref:Uncharacterized protein n=1 Tax=Salvator merianae TaxID=96440 RepID=A0A8D0BSP4_SALMN
MCLGFLAFASWAVKTSDLQAPDAWKIVLLANFGTLSAIRFLRRHKHPAPKPSMVLGRRRRSGKDAMISLLEENQPSI